MRLIRTISLIVVTALVTVFFVQNLATIEVAFITWSIAAPRAVIFFLIFCAGWLIGWLVQTLHPWPGRKRPAARAENAAPPRPLPSPGDAAKE